MNAAGRDAAQAANQGRGGFSLLEVVVSMIIMTYGVLGLAGTTMYTIRQVTLAEMSAKRVAAIQSVVEGIRAAPFDSVSTGSTTLGHYNISWSAASTSSSHKLVTLISVGPGSVATPNGPMISASATDTLEYRVVDP